MRPTLGPFRIALRALRKQPAFASVVILSLGLSIALNTSMYGVLDAHATQLPVALRRAGFAFAETMDVAQGLTRGRITVTFVTKLFVAFAVFGLGLAAFGVYGVVAHSVAERRRELGVRVALGASGRDILHTVLRETVVLGLAGVAVGLLVTKYCVPMLSAFALDEIYNAPLFATAAIFLLAIGALSAFIPAVRATRVDPTESLRCE